MLPFWPPSSAILAVGSHGSSVHVVVLRRDGQVYILPASGPTELFTYSFNIKLKINLIGWVWIMCPLLNQSLWLWVWKLWLSRSHAFSISESGPAAEDVWDAEQTKHLMLPVNWGVQCGWTWSWLWEGMKLYMITFCVCKLLGQGLF